jgi:hypothetical protein
MDAMASMPLIASLQVPCMLKYEGDVKQLSGFSRANLSVYLLYTIVLKRTVRLLYTGVCNDAWARPLSFQLGFGNSSANDHSDAPL